jgi:hypothetical protein
MKTNIRFWVIIFCTAIILTASSCNRDKIKVYPVKGTITYNGSPLDQASISFIPKDASGRGAVASSDSSGYFEVITHGVNRKGAIAGEYHVIVSKEIAVDANGKQITISPIPPDQLPTGTPQTRPLIKSLIPEKYNNPQKPLLETVIIQGKNIIELNLQD